MAKKISQLTQATEVKSDDVTVIVQDGETKKLPLNMMVTKQDIENKKIAGLAKLDEIEATYENDTYTPTITVKNKSSVKTGEGDEVDYSANVMDGHAKSAILKGSTKYRDIDTGEVLDAFEDGRNLELVSVKLPVLTTTGKNLFDGEYELDKFLKQDGTIAPSANWATTKNYIRVKPNTTYTQNIRMNSSIVYVVFYDKNKNIISAEKGIDLTSTYNSATYTTPNNCYFIKTCYNYGYVGNHLFQIEEGSVVTTYEPYKTNILSTSEDVTLRKIGEVKDELDCLSGKLTERVGEIVLNGSEKWEYSNGTFRSSIIADKVVTQNNKSQIYVICDRYKSVSYSGSWSGDFISLHTNKQIVFGDGRFTTTQEWKEYLTQNPLTVYYQFETESIKTVDLMPSGTHPSTTPYCWKNGHIQLSSSGLLPNLEYSVVTSRAGQINQNATMIVKNDKRIFDLEILLAGGLVNTTYQALTLQNQVETGLSKVSLNSEKEPDYLLYHMIMKLIEEKAYKLDDLTEKVSVFYLYEKLSDEQFETIYSALYPFVEDEIVEEPVVEELPEVVEDEVIM